MTPPPHGTDHLLKKIAGIIEFNLDNEQFGVSELSREMGMSRSNLHRKIKTATGKSVSRFIREVRLDKALELLKDSDLSVSEVAFRVGFGSPTYFTKCFHDYFGFPPGEAANGEREEEERIEPSDHPISNTDFEAVPNGQIRSAFTKPWFITTMIVIAAAVLLIIAFKPFQALQQSKNIVIAVLPFRNDSPDRQDDYIINGLMEEILNKLSKVEGLGVPSRTTMEKYRDSEKNIRQIAREIGADYILEGSATILDNHTRIRIQLIEPFTDTHIWSEPYDREITTENIFEIQDEIALAVSDGLNIVRKPELTELVQKKPTENVEAYDAYLQARNLININEFKPDQNYLARSRRAKELLEQAISLDSTFADAYTYLAGRYFGNLFFWEMDSHLEMAYAYLDTGLYYAEKALFLYEKKSKGKKPADLYYHYAMLLKATYFQRNGLRDSAEWYFEESRKEPNKTYREYFGDINWYYTINDFYSTIKYYLKFKESAPADYVTDWWINGEMQEVFRQAGFPELAREQLQEWLTLVGDSAGYYSGMTDLEMWSGNYPQAIENINKVMELDPEALQPPITLSRIYLYMGAFDTAAGIILGLVDRLNEKGLEIPEHWLISYIFQEMGKEEVAEPRLNKRLEYFMKRLQYPIPFTQKGITPFTIARIYSIMGDKEKTLEYLSYLKDIPGADYYFIHDLQKWPSFDLVRDTPEYKEILSDLEKRYQKEHERIERLLKKEGYI